MIDIRCSRDGLKCDDCPIINECKHIELTEEIDIYSLYAKGRTDKYQEIVSEYMLLTEEQVAEIRADVIDEYKNDIITKINEEKSWLFDHKSYNIHTKVVIISLIIFIKRRAEQLKKGNINV